MFLFLMLSDDFSAIENGDFYVAKTLRSLRRLYRYRAIIERAITYNFCNNGIQKACGLSAAQPLQIATFAPCDPAHLDENVLKFMSPLTPWN